MRMKLLGAVALLAIMGHNAQAQDASDAAVLEPVCRDMSSGARTAACMSYFKGAREMLLLMTGYNESRGYPLPYCVTNTATPDILRRLWLNYIDDNPKALAEPATLTLNEVLKQEYPCGGAS